MTAKELIAILNDFGDTEVSCKSADEEESWFIQDVDIKNYMGDDQVVVLNIT